MKKPVLLAVGAAVVALAYPGSAWLLGTRVEAAFDEQYRALEEQPYIKVVSRDYQRGLFSATETVTFELTGLSEILATKHDADMETADAPPATPAESLRFTIRTEIKHGPLPGFSAFGAATADSELVLTPEQQAAVTKVFGDKKPLQVHSVFGLLGGGSSTLSSPATTFDTPAKEGEKPLHVVWNGLEITADFTSHMKQYSFKGEIPGFEISDGNGGHGQLSGLHIEGEQQRVFDDLPNFYSGTVRMTLAQLIFTETAKEGSTTPTTLFDVKQLAYDASVPVNGEFVDLIGKIAVETAQFEGENYGPAHYDFSLRHLHARTTAELYQKLMKWYADPARLAAEKNGNPMAGLETLRDPALALLKYAPEIRLDRLSFNSPQGEANVSATVKLGEIQAEELANPFALLGKLDAGADLSLPEALMGDLIDADKLGAFEQMGYVTREGKLLRSKIAFAKGQLTVNGKPFNPMAMGGGEAEGDTPPQQ